jgi:paraquat-inducible protein B
LQDDLETLVNKGLRAQLKTGNLLTGQLYVDLDFYPAAPPAEVVSINGQQIFPTIPAPLEQIAQRVDNILDEFEKVPFEKIGKELREAISALTLTLGEIKTISGSVNRETLPRINTTLEDLQGALKGIEATIGEDSALSYNARMLTDEFLVAVRSLRSLLDYLEREPQALIFGKEGEK